MHKHTQDTRTAHEWTDEAMDRLITGLVDDAIDCGVLFMRNAPCLRGTDLTDADLADLLRRGLAAVPRTVSEGDTVDGITRYIAARRAAQGVS